MTEKNVGHPEVSKWICVVADFIVIYCECVVHGFKLVLSYGKSSPPIILRKFKNYIKLLPIE